MGVRRVAGVILAAVLVASVPAVAAADVERNDFIFAPEGPIAGGQDIGGTVSEGDRDDWYLFYAEGLQQLHLRVAPWTATCARVWLTDEDGATLPADYTSPADTTTRFYVHVDRDRFQPCPAGPAVYSFKVDPVGGVVAGPGKTPVRAVAEPNDTLDSAFGPLAPAIWNYGVIETANDHDWLAFYTAPGRQRIDVQTVSYGAHGCEQRPTLANARGRAIEAAVPNGSPPVKHIRRTMRDGARLHVALSANNNASCVGAVTVVQVGPPEAILSGSEVRAACRQAKRASKRWARRLASDRRRLVRVTGGPAELALKRKVKRDRRELRSARRLVSAYCN